MNEKDIINKFNENFDSQDSIPTQSYKSVNNTNLNTETLNTISPLNVNISQMTSEPQNSVPISLDVPKQNEEIKNEQIKQKETKINVQESKLDFTEEAGLNNNQFSNVTYVKKENKKKKNTITITPEIKTAFIIVLILLVMVFFFPEIIAFFRKIFLNIDR